MNNSCQEYIYAISNGTDIKVGYSANVKRRLKQLNTGSAVNLYILCTFTGGRELESQIHNRFKGCRINREWFRAENELLDYLNSMSEDYYVDWDYKKKLRAYSKISM